MLLLEPEGKLSLNDTVAKWYPDLTAASTVSIRELLNHTSGYPDHYPQSYPAGAKGAAMLPHRILKEWGHHPPLFQFMQERIFSRYTGTRQSTSTPFLTAAGCWQPAMNELPLPICKLRPTKGLGGPSAPGIS